MSLFRVKVRRATTVLRRLGLLTFALILVVESAAQVAHSRLFRFAAEPPSSISIGPRGTVWVRHGQSARISGVDGYSVREFTAPEPGGFRVYESRSGQLWTCYAEGVLLHDRASWSRHRIPQIATELQQNPLRQVRQIPVLPAEINRALFLLADRLYEFDARTSRVRTIATSANLGLGNFAELTEDAEGNLWISAAKGVLRARGPLRQLGPETTWERFPFPAGSLIENVHRPMIAADGEMILTGSLPGSTADRVVAILREGQWSFRTLYNQRLKEVWRGWDSTLWGYGYNSLVRLQQLSSAGSVAPIRETFFGAQYDVAVGADGTFWLATSEGLARYAPPLWQTPAHLSEVNTPTYGLVFDGPENFWAATTEGILQVAATGPQRLHRWPENREPFLATPHDLVQLLDGRLAAVAGMDCLLFDPTTGEFEGLRHPTGQRLHYLGIIGASLAFQTVPAKDVTSEVVLYTGDEFATLFTADQIQRLGPELFFATETRAGDIWVGGNGGVGVFRATTEAFDYFGPENGYFPGRSGLFLEATENKFWIATGEQITEFSEGSWRVIYSSPERIFGLMKTRQGKILMSTAGGVVRLENGAFISNTPEEGLPALAVYDVAEDPQGRIWASTARGVARLNPDADRDAPLAMKPEAVNEATATADSGVLMRFGGVDRWSYSPSGALLYSWRVDKGAWSPYTNTTTATLEDLAPGPHRFAVRAMDRNGNGDTTPAEAEFALVLPWHDDPRLVAVSIAGFALILALAGLAVNRHFRLVRSYAEVEKIVAQRTRELQLANQELLHSQKMRALGTLAAGIAHDFNNILSIIKGSAQIIEANLHDDAKVQTRVGRIKMMVDQGSGIVRSMLGLGTLSERQASLVDPVSLVEDTVRALSEKVPNRIQLEVQRDEVVNEIRCYKDLLQQILVNLILNAVDAIEGEGEIRVRFHCATAPEKLTLEPAPAPEYFSIFVEDTGHGIMPEALPRIFEPFFTTKALSSRRGTGLGLSMVYELAKGMGCGLGVFSEPGVGTVFQIVIPQSGARTEKKIETQHDAARLP